MRKDKAHIAGLGIGVILVVAVPIVAALILALVFYCYYAIPVRYVSVTQGTTGLFQIGETKEALLSRLPEETYSPEPKPSECPRNWIEVSKATEIEKACLLSSSEWQEGDPSTRGLCPEHVDVTATLKFRGDLLVKVVTICRHPE
jgi:hypothetical protein